MAPSRTEINVALEIPGQPIPPSRTHIAAARVICLHSVKQMPDTERGRDGSVKAHTRSREPQS
jgi:hypothetical protein